MSEAFKDFLGYFEQDEQRYPWLLDNGAIADDVETDLEHLSAADATDLEQRSQRFFSSLDSLLEDKSSAIETKLFARVGTYLPRQQCLDILKICQGKQQLVSDVAEQLRLAIADLLPQWSGEDRAIFVRSYAGAFRGGGDQTLQQLTTEKVWDEMSPLEQAQSTVAIADFVLTELNSMEASDS